MNSLEYAVVTPTLNEATNIGRLAESLAEQSVPPRAWVIVDTGSSDGTEVIVKRLAEAHPWIQLESVRPASTESRAAPIVRAFERGVSSLHTAPEVLVKLDADISFDKDHFRRLLDAFEDDPRLGIASGSAFELAGDRWRQRHGTGLGVWGACRAYRRDCLTDVLPLEQRIGWDTIDLVKAAVAGWNVRVIEGLPFRHHRPEGGRERTPWHRWIVVGQASYFLGYRSSYLLLRTLYRALRQPAALGIAAGFLGAAIRREPRYSDAAVREQIRREQRLRLLPVRAREALRRRVELRDQLDPS